MVSSRPAVDPQGSESGHPLGTLSGRVIRWPAPPGAGGEGAYAVKVSGLPWNHVAGVADASVRAGFQVSSSDGEIVIEGPGSCFVAVASSAHDALSAAARVVDRFRNPPRVLRARMRTFDLGRPLVVGILNATPDSFYDHGRYFDRERTRVIELTTAILQHPLLSRFLILLALEWGTQRHYVESVREPIADPVYVDVLRAHWVEEAQHTKWDTVEIARLANGASVEELGEAFDHVLGIGQLIDATFAGQVDAEIETLRRVGGRAFADEEIATLRDALHRSMSAIIAGVALTHPSFAKVARGLSQEGAAKLGIAR